MSVKYKKCTNIEKMYKCQSNIFYSMKILSNRVYILVIKNI